MFQVYDYNQFTRVCVNVLQSISTNVKRRLNVVIAVGKLKKNHKKKKCPHKVCFVWLANKVRMFFFRANVEYSFRNASNVVFGFFPTIGGPEHALLQLLISSSSNVNVRIYVFFVSGTGPVRAVARPTQ